MPDNASNELGRLPEEVERPGGDVEGDNLASLQDTADIQVERVTDHATELIAKVEADVAAGIDADAQHTIQALQAVQHEARSLRAEFSRRLHAILGAIGDRIRAMQERRQTEQLAIPDNPKIIKRLVRDLKRTDTPLEPSLELYARAEKYRNSAWSEIASLIDHRIVVTVPTYIDTGRIDAALRLYDAASRDIRYSTLDTVIARGVANTFDAITPAGGQFSAEAYLARREQFGQLDKTARELLGDRSQLAYTYRQLVPELQRKVFSEPERALFAQSVDVIRPLANFPADQQAAIVDSWVTHPRIDWSAIMLDEHATTIVGVLTTLPNLDHYSSQYDRTAIVQIAEKFSPSQQAMAWEKAGTPQCSWDDAHAYMVVGNLPDSTPEQIRSLDAQQWTYVTLTLLAYGDSKVAELWTEDNVLDLKEASERSRGWSSGWYSRDTQPGTYIEFVKSLSPILREHLPIEGRGGSGNYSQSRPEHVVWEHSGFQGVPRLMADFQSVIAMVPAAYTDELFRVLAPMRYATRLDEHRYTGLTSTQAKNCIEYITTNQSIGKLELTTLLDVAEYFTDERWPRIRNGITICQAEGLTIPTAGSRTDVQLQVYERAGNPDQANVNSLWKVCQERSPAYVRQKAYHAKEFESAERTTSSILALQRFTEVCDEYFSGQPEYVAEYMNFNDTERQVITKWLDGTLLANANDALDLPVIEGVMIALGQRFEYYKEERLGELRDFTQLSPDQQQCWLYLRKNILWLGGVTERSENASQLFALVVSEAGQQVEEFIRTYSLQNFTPDAIVPMAQRPDCVGLYYYVDPRTIQAEQHKLLVDRLIALRDAGFPDTLMLTQPDTAAQVSNDRGTYGDRKTSYGSLMQWEPTRLAQVAQYAVQHHPELTLLRLFRLNPEDPLERSQFSIDYATAERSTFLKTNFDAHYQAGSQEEIDKIYSRRGRVESVTGTQCNGEEIAKLQRIPDPAWDILTAQPDVLLLYLHGKKYYISEADLALPAELLRNPLAWQQDLPAPLWADPEKMQSAIYIIERLTEAGISYTEYGTPWEHWVEAWQQAPWLFTAENLAIVEQTDTRLGIAQFAACTEAEWQAMAQDITHYHFDHSYRIGQYIEQWRTGTNLLTPELRAAIETYVQPIHWEDAVDIAQRLQRGEALADIASSKDGSGEYDDRAWKRDRVAQYRKQVQEHLPTFCEHNEISVTDWQVISELPVAALQRLEQLSSYAKDNIRYYQRTFNNLIALAQHPQFELVSHVLAIDSHGVIGQSTDDFLQFCDELTPRVVEQLQQWPRTIELRTIDANHFFNDPKSAVVADLAGELIAILGDDISISVYDLLIMDAETDLANVRILQQNSILPITPDYLRKLAPATTGSMHVTVTKLLAMCDHSYKIDVNQSLEEIKTLQPELRFVVLKHKAPGNYGVSFIKEYPRLMAELEISREDISVIVCHVYDVHAQSISEIDADLAHMVLEDQTVHEDTRIKRMLHIAKSFTGDSAMLPDILLEHVEPAVLHRAVGNDWSQYPESVRNSDRIWEAVITTQQQIPTNMLAQDWTNIPDRTVQSDEFWQTINRFPKNCPTKRLVDYMVQVNGHGNEVRFTQAAGVALAVLRLTDPVLRESPELQVVTDPQLRERFQSVLKELFTAVRDPGGEYLPYKEFLMSEHCLYYLARQPERLPDVLQITTLPHLFNLMQAGGPLHSNYHEVVRDIFSNGNSLGRARQIESVFARKIPYWKQLFYYTDVRLGESLASSGSPAPVRGLGSINFADMASGLPHRLATFVSDPALQAQLAAGEATHVQFGQLSGVGKRMVFRQRIQETVEFSRSNERKQRANLRNRATAQDKLEFSSTFAAHGTKGEILRNILWTGNLPGEALGAQSRTDAFPFHTDFWHLDPNYPDPAYAIHNPAELLAKDKVTDYATGSNPIILLYDRSQPEAYDYQGEINGGVRGTLHKVLLGGMPSTEIQAIVALNPAMVDTLARTIAENGFYIPVYSVEGTVLFTANDYDTYVAEHNLGVAVDIWDYTMRIGDQQGSNAGGMYAVPSANGPERHYVKFAEADNYDRLWNEHLTNSIYRALGVPVPETSVVFVDGSYGHASKIIAADGSPDLRELRHGFIADCLLANWDIVFERNLISSNGILHRIDNGGALLFRARGERRDNFNGVVTELSSMRSSYPELSTEDITRQTAQLRAELSDTVIDELVDSVRLSQEDRAALKTILKERREYIVEYFTTPSTEVAGQESSSESVNDSDTGTDTIPEPSQAIAELLNSAEIDDAQLARAIPEWTRIIGPEGYQHNGVLLGQHLKDAVRTLHTLPEYSGLTAREQHLASLAMLFHDFGKPTGRQGESVRRDYNHDVPSAALAAKYMKEWGHTARDIATVVNVIINDGVVSDIARGKVRDERKQYTPARLRELVDNDATTIRILRAVNKSDVIATVGEARYDSIAGAYNTFFEEVLKQE